MTPEEAQALVEELEAWILEVDERAHAGAPLLVEGEKDVATLRRLGVAGPVQRVHGTGTLMSVAEGLAARGVREVVVLTDWDRTGGRLARRLSEVLTACGVRADLEARGRLARAAREIRHVESLDTYLATLRARAGARTG